MFSFTNSFYSSSIGIGISEDELKGLFSMFYVSNNNRAVLNCKGTGLGLTITQKLVNMLGGKIRVESEENKGTQVYFSIPDGDISEPNMLTTGKFN